MRRGRRIFAAALATGALATFTPSLADAEPRDKGEIESRVKWNERWTKFRWWEYGVTAVGWGTTITSGYVLPDTPFGWRGINDFDEGARDGLRWSSNNGRLNAATASDIMFYSLAAFPIVVDDMIITWAGYKKPALAFQMLMIDLEALGVAGGLSSITERTGRERPYVRTCPEERSGGVLELPCSDTGRNQSFISGHTAAAFAGAGLICVHHVALPLFDSRVADIVMCSTGMGTAVGAAYLRLAADVHYATDVIAAAAVGLGSGLVLPYLLHFRTPSRKLETVGVAPLTVRDGFGLSLQGRLP